MVLARRGSRRLICRLEREATLEWNVHPLEVGSCSRLRHAFRMEQRNGPFLISQRLPHWLRSASGETLWQFLRGSPDRKSCQILFKGDLVGFTGLEPIDWIWRTAGIWCVWLPKAPDPLKVLAVSARYLVRLAFQDLNLHRLYGKVPSENVEALSQLRKEGFRDEGTLRRHRRIGRKWTDEILVARLAGDPDAG